MTLIPSDSRSSAIFGVMPKPPAAFSPLAMTRLIRYSSIRESRCLEMSLRPTSPMMSPIKSIRTKPLLFRQLHVPALPDHGNLNLARIGQLIMDLFGHLAGNLRCLGIRDILLFNNDANLPAGGYGVGLLHPFKGSSNLLQILQALDIRLKGLPPCPRPCP